MGLNPEGWILGWCLSATEEARSTLGLLGPGTRRFDRRWDARASRPEVLPRKEVIQPHLPVRLPCYDFTPLTLYTFGASLP